LVALSNYHNSASSVSSGAQFKRLRALIGGNVDGVFESRVSFSPSFPFQLFAIKASSR
jgi:hypothetical protein